MIHGIKEGYPLLNKSHKKMAKCRLCGEVMFGLYDQNMRFYCDCCDQPEDAEILPRPIKLKVYPKKTI